MEAAHGKHFLGDGKEVGAFHLLGDGGNGSNVGGASGGSTGHGDKGEGGNGNIGDVGASKHVWNLDVCGLRSWVDDLSEEIE